MYYSDELYHHGIKGQRWGRRNGPPYPLSPQTHAAVVRSAGRNGRVSGLKEIGERMRYGTIFDPSKDGREVFAKGKKVVRKTNLRTLGGMAAGGALGAGIGYAVKRNHQGAGMGGAIGANLGTLAGSLSMYADKDYKDYRKSYSEGMKKLKAKQAARNGKVGGLSEEEARRAKRNKIIRNVAIGAGGAALAGAAAYGLARRGGYGNYVKNTAKGIPGKIAKNKNKLYNTYLREAGKVRRSASNAKDYVKRTYNNKIKTIPRNTKELLSKPGSKVYERIAGESKRAAQAANYDLSVNAKRKQALEKFIQENPKAIENATIAKRKVLANIRRGDTLRNLNAKANKLAAKERDLVNKGNEAKRLLGELNSQTKLGTERYNAAMATFNKRNRLGKIAAGATNAGIGLGLAGAAGGAGYGISRLARKRRSRKRRRR